MNKLVGRVLDERQRGPRFIKWKFLSVRKRRTGLLAPLIVVTGGTHLVLGAYLSDRMLIESALRHEMGEGHFHPPCNSTRRNQVLRDYPTCCRVDRWDHPFLANHFLNALFGRRFFAVENNYPVAPKAGREDPYYNAILIMDCCGEDVPDHSGIGRSTWPGYSTLPRN